MRTVARFKVEASPEPKEAQERIARIRERMEAWLGGKGTTEVGSEGAVLVLRDGRRASFATESYEGSDVALAWQIDEPVPQGRFQTRLTLACRGEAVEFAATLRAGNDTGSLARFNPDVRRPKIVTDVLRRWSDWRVGQTGIRNTAMPLFGRTTGATFADVLTTPTRSLPMVVVTEHDSFPIHPQLRDWLAEDLIGLGLVYQLDGEAAWGLTESLGVERSCHSGAVRIYWPGFGEDGDDPRRHPLWTKDRMLGGAVDAIDAAEKVRQTIRWKVLAMSAFAAGGRSLFDEVRDAALRAEAAKRRSLIETTAQEKAYFESEALRLEEEKRAIAVQSDELRRQVEDLTKATLELIDEKDALEARVRSLTEALQFKEGLEAGAAGAAPADVAPDASVETVSDAVNLAKKRFCGELEFGADVEAGIGSLDPSAGPPGKVFRYLSLLAELAREKRASASIGATDLRWLQDRGASGSKESDTIRNDKAKMKKRRWNDGDGERQFDSHLKPSDQTAADLCVRIYFDWDEVRRRIVVGWIGRHP